MLQLVHDLAGPRIPNCDRPIHGGGGELPAVRAEGRADGRGVVLHGRRVAVALPLEEMPLPAAPVEWALVEQLLGAADVAGGQLAPCQGDTLDVRSFLLTFKGLLRLLLFVVDLRIAGCQYNDAADQAANGHEHRHCNAPSL